MFYRCNNFIVFSFSRRIFRQNDPSAANKIIDEGGRRKDEGGRRKGTPISSGREVSSRAGEQERSRTSEQLKGRDKPARFHRAEQLNSGTGEQVNGRGKPARFHRGER